MSDLLQRAAAATSLSGGEPPSEIRLLPAGRIETRPHDNRDAFHNSDPDAVVEATRRLKLDLPIDYEHQSHLSKTNGQPAPAAGWIKRVFARNGEIWGEVEWTGRARKFIENREYRFISAAFQINRLTRAVARLTGAALTNDPALYMEAIASAQTSTEEDHMDPRKLRKALGLSADATDEQVLAAASAALAARTALANMAGALGLAKDTGADQIAVAATARHKGLADVAAALRVPEDASVEKILAAASAKASGDDPDPEKFVPRAEFDAVNVRLKTLEDSTAEASATSQVDEAVKAGKLTPASRDWALGYAAKDPEGFATFLDGQPTILASGRVMPAGKPEGGKPSLTEDELAICRATGISEEDYIKSAEALEKENGNG